MNGISKRQYWVIVIVAALVSWSVAYILRIWTDWDPFIKGFISGLIASLCILTLKRLYRNKGNG